MDARLIHSTESNITFELSRVRRSQPWHVGWSEGEGRRFVLRPTALVIGRQAVAKVLPCFLLDR